MQYFVFAVAAVFLCSFAPLRATAVLTVVALAAAIASVAMSIQTASELISSPAGSALRVPMPVIGIDWMQVCPKQPPPPPSVSITFRVQEGAMPPGVDAFYSSLYLR